MIKIIPHTEAIIPKTNPTIASEVSLSLFIPMIPKIIANGPKKIPHSGQSPIITKTIERVPKVFPILFKFF